MKKAFIIIAIVLATATTITIVSCKKDKENEKSNVSFGKESSTQENMDEYLLSFKKKLQNATKGSETISFEQARHDLCNLLNFDFGDANYATNEIRFDTLYASFSMTDNVIDLYQLNSVYKTLFEQVVATYKTIDLPDKSIYSIYCTFANSQSEDIVNVTAVMKTRSYIETPRNYLDWRAGNLAGTCENQLVGICGAPERLSSMLRANIGYYSCEDGGRVYFTEEECSYKTAEEDDMIDTNAPRGKRLFYGTDYSQNPDIENTCIPYNELVYYYNQARYLDQTHGSSFHPNPIPANHDVTDYSIQYIGTIAGHIGYWKINIWHAKVNCTSSSPSI